MLRLTGFVKKIRISVINLLFNYWLGLVGLRKPVSISSIQDTWMNKNIMHVPQFSTVMDIL